MSENISFYGALSGVFEYQSSQMFTSIPAIVVGVKSLAEKRIDVQPALNIRTVDGETDQTMPSILNVPLQLPMSSQGGVSFPISVGDSVLLVFSQRGIDNWKRGNGFSAPSNMRKFDASDAIAIAGVQPFPESSNSPSKHSWTHNPEDVVLVHGLGSGNETEVRLLKSGGVVVNTNQNVEVNCEKVEVNSKDFTINSDSFEVNSGSVQFASGSFDIGTGSYSLAAGSGGATSSGTLQYSGSFILNGTPIENHSHGGVESGSSTTNPFGS